MLTPPLFRECHSLPINGAEAIKSYAVYSLQGQKIDVRMEEGQLNLETLPKGMYYIHLEDYAGNAQTSKISLH